MNQLVGPFLRPVRRWAEDSQRAACRNAMVAATSLAAGRKERDETREFVAAVLAHRARPTDPTTAPTAHSTAPTTGTLPATRLG